MAQKMEYDTGDGELIYESAERGSFYNCIRCLWCACCEPHHKITTKYVKVHKWEGCSQITDSMAMEAINDISRQQSCCCCMASCCCGCCINDFADIELYGHDKTVENDILLLENVAHSDQVMITITRHLQEIHKDFRKNGKLLGKELNKIKHNA
eukprot:UN04902